MAGNRASDRLAKIVSPSRSRALNEAIETDSISLKFQPQVHPDGGAVIGVEALARWAGEDDTEALFEHAKAAGLVERLSRHVQRKAIAMAARWSDELGCLNLSINVVAEDIGREGYEHWLLHELEAHQFDPQRLTIEVTESSIVADEQSAARRISRLRNQGIRVALDDFGSGYANMTYLARFPLDVIKIDRGLIAQLDGQRGQIVVRSLLSMARELDLITVVEGVETANQLASVREWGCDLVQGFLTAGSLDEVELAQFVAAKRRAAA